MDKKLETQPLGNTSTLARFLGGITRNIRRQNNLSQQKLAGQTGISQSNISRFENGTGNLSIDELNRIVAVFDVDISHLILAAKIQELEASGNDDNKNVTEFLENIKNILDMSLKMGKPSYIWPAILQRRSA